MSDDSEIGTCQHGRALHYGIPCVDCEADRVVRWLQDDMARGWKSENGLWPKLHDHVARTISDVLARVRQYHGIKE